MKQDEEKQYMTKQAYRRRYQNPKGESRSQLFEHGFPLTHRNHKTETQREVNTPRKEKKNQNRHGVWLYKNSSRLRESITQRYKTEEKAFRKERKRVKMLKTSGRKGMAPVTQRIAQACRLEMSVAIEMTDYRYPILMGASCRWNFWRRYS